MSLHQLYNHAVSTAILLLCTVYWTFLLCLQFCFPFLLYESRFRRFSMNFAPLVFQLSEKVVVRITFPAVDYRRFHFFVFNLLCTSPSFIRFQLKTLKLVFVIRYFYKAFVQFSSHSIEQILKHFLNYSASRRKSLLYFFPGAFNIKLVNSFILV